MFLSSVHFFSKIPKRVSQFKSKIVHLFHKEKDLGSYFAGTST